MNARLLLPIGLGLLLACAATLRGQAPAIPEKGVVLLRNGHMLRGTVANEGQQLLVMLGPGSEVRLPRSEVQFVARSLEELVAIQRRQLHPDDVNGRMQLARWCVRNESPSQAGELLVELVRLAPDRPDVLALERQLRQKVGHAAAPVAGNKTEAPIETAAQSTPAELESLVKEIPPLAFDDYMKHIQPLLLNHCAASGCHGVASRTDFQLLRPLSGTRLTQRMTQRNLQSTLKQIDSDNPLASPLLTAATNEHGGLPDPILAGPTHQKNIDALRQWLEAATASAPVGGTSGESAPASVKLPQDAQRDASPMQSIFAQVPPNKSAAGQAAQSEPATPTVKRGAEPGFSPRDPFDPDAFNRRFFPDRFREK